MRELLQRDLAISFLPLYYCFGYGRDEQVSFRLFGLPATKARKSRHWTLFAVYSRRQVSCCS